MVGSSRRETSCLFSRVSRLYFSLSPPSAVFLLGLLRFFIILRVSYIFTPRYYNCIRILFNVSCTFLISVYLKALICLEYNLLIVEYTEWSQNIHIKWCYVYFISLYSSSYFYIFIYIFKTLIYIFEIIYKPVTRKTQHAWMSDKK